ncbi:MAG: right-handed parallel beta-helix repeat-containing protein, partial [Saprospiraceae bacterium]
MNCDLYDNGATSSGGGMYSLSSSPIISNCNFYDNTAASGGGISNRSSLTHVSNCNFYDNASTDKGGGMYNNNLSASIVSNCNFYDNTADNNGGGMYNHNSSSPEITNCIFWKNSSGVGADSDIENDGSGSSPTVGHSLLQVYTGGMNNMTGTDPLFVDESDPDGADDIPGTSDDGLRLRTCSPARDVGQDNGSNSDVPVSDILGNGRLGITDMGCYEYQTPIPIRIYVNIGVIGGMGDGSSWGNAYTNLQDAIDSACTLDEIWVAEGTYHPTDIPDGATATTSRDRSFHLNKDLKIYGGFDATETLLSERNHQANPTILSGDIGGPNDDSDNCYHVFITANLTSDAVLDGFGIMGGNA